ncbi:hypothetical protein K491DRAFT_19682 [Lophiostoma macrostomum CBS 122681]|uniref:2EXR domain-containing protein n=1 Tax=Lophiostoma macrostomum CBS 122681 TaxID=1314788 RepID=A0A6A6TNV9_9PLEO|nr:hypothetical protein K491DRAFT_19682 [Lophiostoma macrostomum CBS 122681]
MATTFHPFPRLSAELRLHVWHFAIEHDVPKGGRTIVIHSYEPSANIVSVAVSTRYPALFQVNREARYESIKQIPGEIVTIQTKTGHAQDELQSGKMDIKADKFEIFVNFEKDTFFLAERFAENHDDLVTFYRIKDRLLHLTAILPNEAILQIQKLRLSCEISQSSKSDCRITFKDSLEDSKGGKLNAVFLDLDGMSLPSNYSSEYEQFQKAL